MLAIFSRQIICFEFSSWLIKHDDFNHFDLQPRDPSCLPKEYMNAEGTCYFLEGYSHPTVEADAKVEHHIEAAMNQINEN